MKKLFFLAAAAVAMASCSNTEDLTPANVAATPTPVKFSTYLSTRAVTETDLAAVQTTGFYVYATNGDKVLMNNVPVIYDSNESKWNINDNLSYYWPADDTTVDFCAVCNPASPAGSTDDGPFGEGGTLTVTCNGDNQNDIVAAFAAGQSVKSNNGYVNLTFQHLLSQLTIALKAESDDYSYEITKICARGCGDDADCTFSANGILLSPNSTTLGSLIDYPTGYATTDGMTSDDGENVDAETYLFLPGSAYIYIYYKVYNENNVLVDDFSTEGTCKQVEINLSQGKRTNLEITIGYNAPVRFTADLDSWVDDENQSQTVTN